MLKIRYSLLIALLSVISMQAFSQQKKKNIILFLVDDMGWQDTSVPFWSKSTGLNGIYLTPNMERLASRGMKFSNAYANSVCTPTRVSLVTGMNVARHGVTNWTNVKKNTPTDYPDSVLIPPVWNHNGLALAEGINNTIIATSLPVLLKQAGYFNIHCGKAHFAPYGTPASDPSNIGFDVNIAGTAAGHPGSFLAEDRYRNNPNDTTWGVRGLDKYADQGLNLTDALTREAIATLSSNRKNKKPFFLYMSHYAVHLPFSKDKRFYQHYIDKGLSDTEARYAALVEGMDKSLGDLMDYLDTEGIADDTYILFLSDNGGLSTTPNRGGLAHTQNLPLKMGKGSLYEGGIRIPMIAAGPGIARASTNNQYVGIDDIFPTVLELAGLKKYNTVQQVDGRSIRPFLFDSVKTDNEKVLLWHYPNNWTTINLKGISWASAIRKGNWKLIYFHKAAKLELYDIQADIGEKNDLSMLQSEKLKEMAGLLTNELKKRGAAMPTYKITGKQIPWPDELYEQIADSLRLRQAIQPPGKQNETANNFISPSKYHIHRQSLQNSYNKFSQEKKGRVAFMGGSITEGGAWRGKIESYLKGRFPDTDFEFINAGISSTGSTPGAFRLEQDVLSKGPIDLFFEEAAVNDEVNGFNGKAQLRGMEGIISHALRRYPNMDVVMLHFVDPPKLEIYKNGGVPEVILNHEKVAERYKVNSIHLAREISDRIVAGEFNWKDDFKDLHPSEFGHEIYARSISTFLDNAFAMAASDSPKPTSRKLPEALDSFSYTSGQYLPVNQAINAINWNFIDKWSPKDGVSTRKRYVDIPAMVAEVSGAEMKLEFSGKAIGICIASGPDAGMIEYSIDGAAFKKIDLYTQWSGGLHLPWYVMLNDELEAKKHTVIIRTLSEKNNKSKGNACRILHFLVN
ncbi:MAG: sulfatase-like hydrolase/transferase [Daejeonella sp.]|uniref:sulfatase-like hydrolase/transferase n=1 Tax=Daejeonella sp. TaxID=2805397 RepID=UPI002736F687|nr:sulfatase-like hydrolase/transferase [Daejeonella sp.]MDP3469807.1 sulfatase-like hydrolase/transferase [Daejeonella sp.]